MCHSLKPPNKKKTRTEADLRVSCKSLLLVYLKKSHELLSVFL